MTNLIGSENVRYRGISEGVGHDRVYVERDGSTKPLAHYSRHSPTGFSWGYAGSGPAETARCILADFLELEPIQHRSGLLCAGDIPELEAIYQKFKFDHIATLPKNGGTWELDGAIIAAWLASHPPTNTCATCRHPLDVDDPDPCTWCLDTEDVANHDDDD